MSQSISTLGERALLERLRRRVPASPAWVTLGIGDDAAVLEPARGTVDVVTTDSLIEDVHFRRAWTPAGAIGHKALAVNLSDLAAMGAAPRASLLSLALPEQLPVDDFDALVDGFVTLAARFGAPLVGGNLSRSPGPLVLDVTAIGAAKPRQILTRAGGRPGDALYVTGSIGAAAAGLAMLRAGRDRSSLDESARECVARYEQPDPRLRCGTVVGRSRAARACIDLSDGLADAAHQLAEASRTGVVLEADTLPVHPGAAAWATATGADPIDLALSGGDDYELLFAVGPRQRRAFLGALRRCQGLAVTAIGRLAAEPGAWFSRGGRLEQLPEGFRHF